MGLGMTIEWQCTANILCYTCRGQLYAEIKNGGMSVMFHIFTHESTHCNFPMNVTQGYSNTFQILVSNCSTFKCTTRVAAAFSFFRRGYEHGVAWLPYPYVIHSYCFGQETLSFNFSKQVIEEFNIG